MVNVPHLRDAVAGHHVAGTPVHYHHGWIPVAPGMSASRPGHSRVTTAKGWIQTAITSAHRQELKKENASLRKHLTAPQLKTVEQWTSGKGMVRRIQTGKTSKATADAFDAAMQQAPKVDGLVYRGVKPDSELAKLAERMRPGTRLRLDEPVSTSIDPGQASSFGSVMFEIDSPAAAYISGIGSRYAYEQEAVLAPGEFRVVSVEYVKIHYAGHGVHTLKVIKIVDETASERAWRHIDRAGLRRSAADGSDDSEGNGDRSDRFMAGDGPGQFYVASAGAPQPSGGRGMSVPPVESRGPSWPDFATLVARTAETPVASTVHEPFGSPSGPGLFHVKGLQLPAYVQHVAHHLVAQGHPESKAIQIAIGVVRNWAHGHDGHGNAVHPDVQAAAVKAMAEWEAAKAAAHAKGRANMTHTETRAKYDAAQMKAMAAKGQAMKNESGQPSYPIADEEDLHNAIRAVGRGGGSHNAIRKHIIARAKALGLSSAIPDNWSADGSMSGADDNGRSASGHPVERRYTASTVGIVLLGGEESRDGTRSTRIGGYAAKFNTYSRDLGHFVEEIDPGFFNKSKGDGWPGVICRFNHENSQLLGTVQGRTLGLNVDRDGLVYDVDPPPSMRHVVEYVERGDVQKSSFAFRSYEEDWGLTPDGGPLRRLYSGQLVDVAPVVDPAYIDTTAGLRSFAAHFEAEFEEVRAMAEAHELRRFFVRTDGPQWKPPPPKVNAAAAMMQLMEKRRDPWA